MFAASVTLVATQSAGEIPTTPAIGPQWQARCGWKTSDPNQS